MPQKKEQSERDGMTVQEAGRMGGKATSHKYGKEFYEEIGVKGGNTTKKKHGPEFYSQIGKEGGQHSHSKKQ